MEKYIKSQDGFNIHYQISGAKKTAIVFVHGWLGNAEWWKNQREYFKNKYSVVQIDLPGHGKSEKGRVSWTSIQYANDIKDIVKDIESENIVLVGHSMSGPYTLEAALITPRIRLVVLVDTLKNMDKMMDYQQADDFLFKSYKQDFKNAVKNLLPKFLYSESTPFKIREQLQNEFLKNDAEFAVKSIEPLYKMNIRNIAKKLQIPVRAINSDFTSTDIKSIYKYFTDFAYVTIPGSGHYPMLEQPEVFNLCLYEILNEQLL